MSIQRLIDIVQEAYPDTEVLIRTNISGKIVVRNPETETVEMPARYFANLICRSSSTSPNFYRAYDGAGADTSDQSERSPASSLSRLV